MLTPRWSFRDPLHSMRCSLQDMLKLRHPNASQLRLGIQGSAQSRSQRTMRMRKGPTCRRESWPLSFRCSVAEVLQFGVCGTAWIRSKRVWASAHRNGKGHASRLCNAEVQSMPIVRHRSPVNSPPRVSASLGDPVSFQQALLTPC